MDLRRLEFVIGEDIVALLLEVSEDCKGFLGTYGLINDINTLNKVTIIGSLFYCHRLGLLSISSFSLLAITPDINGADERLIHVRVCLFI